MTTGFCLPISISLKIPLLFYVFAMTKSVALIPILQNGFLLVLEFICTHVLLSCIRDLQNVSCTVSPSFLSDPT